MHQQTAEAGLIEILSALDSSGKTNQCFLTSLRTIYVETGTFEETSCPLNMNREGGKFKKIKSPLIGQSLSSRIREENL